MTITIDKPAAGQDAAKAVGPHLSFLDIDLIDRIHDARDMVQAIFMAAATLPRTECGAIQIVANEVQRRLQYLADDIENAMTGGAA